MSEVDELIYLVDWYGFISSGIPSSPLGIAIATFLHIRPRTCGLFLIEELQVRLLVLSLVSLIILTSTIRADDPSSLQSASINSIQLNEAKAEASQHGDVAWMLIATGLVFLMIPGLALFYGGMVRRKNILGTMMHSMVALAVVGIQWVLVGYCLAFGSSINGWIGWSPEFLGLQEKLAGKNFANTNVPIYLHCMFQGMFAIITPALISGAFAERVRFGPYCLFILLWTTLVYDPLAHWVWAIDAEGNAAGWLGKLGALDFAGGTVVHIAAGVAGLAAVLILKKRTGYPEHAIHPNSIVLTLVGAGLLWFGWFGFNAGSALGASRQAVSALAVTQVAAAAAAFAWLVVEWLHRGKPTALGLASGVVAGLVAITPASGFVAPTPALLIGLLAGVVCYVAVALKHRFAYDDSLDAFGIHGVGGIIGAILTGVFVSSVLYKDGFGNSSDPGKLADGRLAQISAQLIATGVAIAYSFIVTLVLVVLIERTIGFSLDTRSESEGLDRCQHGEVGFDLGPALDTVPERPLPEPRPAAVPPNGAVRRFTVVVEGAPVEAVRRAWADLCQAGPTPPPADFQAVYPYLTTVQGNRFRFRGGDQHELRLQLQRLLTDKLDGAAVRTYVES